MRIAIWWSSCFYHVIYRIIEFTCSWVPILTEFGSKSCHLQDWIRFSTVPTDGEFYYTRRFLIFVHEFLDKHTVQVCIWNIMFLRKLSPVSYVLPLYYAKGRGQLFCPDKGPYLGPSLHVDTWLTSHMENWLSATRWN